MELACVSMRTRRKAAGMSQGTDIPLVIEDWDYIMSTLGNAYFSGLTFTEVWDCVTLSTNREEFDTAVLANLRLKELLSYEK